MNSLVQKRLSGQWAWADLWMKITLSCWNLFYLSIQVWGNWTNFLKIRAIRNWKKWINIIAVTFGILFKKSRTSISIIGSPSMVLTHTKMEPFFVLVREMQCDKGGPSLPVIMKDVLLLWEPSIPRSGHIPEVAEEQPPSAVTQCRKWMPICYRGKYQTY